MALRFLGKINHKVAKVRILWGILQKNFVPSYLGG